MRPRLSGRNHSIRVDRVPTRIIPFRERLKKRKKLILFISTADTCRSPMASGHFRLLLEQNRISEIEVRSAGVMTISGLLASSEAVQVMDGEQVDLRRHRSTKMTEDLIRKSDLILAMTPYHRQMALRMSPEARSKTHLFKEFTRSDLNNVQIADPMGCTLEVFKRCFREIKSACVKLIRHEYVSGNTAVETARRAKKKQESQSVKTDQLKKSARKNKPIKVVGPDSSGKSGKTRPSKPSKVAKKAAARKKSAAVGTNKNVSQKKTIGKSVQKAVAKKAVRKAPVKKAGKKGASKKEAVKSGRAVKKELIRGKKR